MNNYIYVGLLITFLIILYIKENDLYFENFNSSIIPLSSLVTFSKLTGKLVNSSNTLLLPSDLNIDNGTLNITGNTNLNKSKFNSIIDVNSLPVVLMDENTTFKSNNNYNLTSNSQSSVINNNGNLNLTGNTITINSTNLEPTITAPQLTISAPPSITLSTPIIVTSPSSTISVNNSLIVKSYNNFNLIEPIQNTILSNSNTPVSTPVIITNNNTINGSLSIQNLSGDKYNMLAQDNIFKLQYNNTPILAIDSFGNIVHDDSINIQSLKLKNISLNSLDTPNTPTGYLSLANSSNTGLSTTGLSANSFTTSGLATLTNLNVPSKTSLNTATISSSSNLFTTNTFHNNNDKSGLNFVNVAISGSNSNNDTKYISNGTQYFYGSDLTNPIGTLNSSGLTVNNLIVTGDIVVDGSKQGKLSSSTEFFNGTTEQYNRNIEPYNVSSTTTNYAIDTNGTLKKDSVGPFSFQTMNKTWELTTKDTTSVVILVIRYSFVSTNGVRGHDGDCLGWCSKCGACGGSEETLNVSTRSSSQANATSIPTQAKATGGVGANSHCTGQNNACWGGCKTDNRWYCCGCSLAPGNRGSTISWKILYKNGTNYKPANSIFVSISGASTVKDINLNMTLTEFAG